MREVAAHPHPADFEQESKVFKTRAWKVGKQPENWDFSGRYEVFEGCGDMEIVGRLMQQLEEAYGGKGFDPVTKSRSADWIDGVKAVMEDAELEGLCQTVGNQRLDWAVAENDGPKIRYALLNAKQLHAGGALGEEPSPSMQTALESFRTIFQLPLDWDMKALMHAEFGFRMLSKTSIINGPVFDALQQLLNDTFVAAWTHDRGRLDGGAVPTRFELARADIVQNVPNYREYAEERARLASLGRGFCEPRTDVKTMTSSAASALPALNTDINELWLYHGTTVEAAKAITTEDFKLKFVGSRAGTLYGAGVYLAEACTKSDEYTAKGPDDLRPLILCRGLCGKMNYTDVKNPDVDSLYGSVKAGRYHSVLGDREKCSGTYREFIVYKEAQVYPAYILWYRRISA